MPGSGKTYWGRKIARELNFSFQDLDDAIENSTGRKVKDIIKEDGEQYFRDIETATLSDTFDNCTEALVLATGGGTPCFNSNLKILEERTFSIYLKQEENILYHNLKDEYHDRPVFKTNDDLLLQIISMNSKREAFYEQADVVLNAPFTIESFLEVIPA